MGTTSEKLTYLNTTKTLIKDNLNLGGANISNEPFRVYSSKLIDIYKDFLANGTDTLWNNWLPKVTGTGENITLNNTIEAKMDFVYKGNTSQYSTTGKNLYDKSKISSVLGGTNNNGIITATNGNCSVFLSSGGYIPVNNGETIYFSADIKLNSSSSGVWNNINDGVNGGTKKILTPTLSTTYQRYQTSFTYSSNRSIDRIFIQIFNLSGSIEISNIMISKNNNANYEPYTNGASPNPDYPQDIQVVSGDNTIEICGKNLLPLTNQDLTINGVSFKAQNGKIIINGTATSNISGENLKNDNSFPITLKAGTYYFKRTSNDISTGLIDDNNNTIVSLPNSADTYEQSFTLSSDKKLYLFFFIASGRTITNYEYELMISNTATTYEPYQSASYPINLGNIELCKIGDYQDKIAKSSGKNLFDKDTVEEKNIDITTGAITDNNYWRLSDYISVIPSTNYMSSMINHTSNQIYVKVVYYDNTKTFISGVSSYFINNRYYGFTTPNNAKYIRFAYLVIISDIPQNIDNIMINEGTTALPYEPYGKVWYLNKQIGKVVLDGTQNITLASGTPRRFNATYTTLGINNVKSGSTALETQNNYRMCDYFYYALGVNTWGVYYLHNNWLVLLDSGSAIASASDLATWLSNNPTTIYYVLATPTYEEITDTTLISQLEAIKKSYNTQTNISQTNADKPFILDVVALGELD